MPQSLSPQDRNVAAWEPEAADSRLAMTAGGRNQELVVLTQAMYNAREFAMARMRAEADHLAAATGTAVRRLADEHRLPETSPKPMFTLGLDS
jgi:hypothetical protein